MEKERNHIQRPP